MPAQVEKMQETKRKNIYFYCVGDQNQDMLEYFNKIVKFSIKGVSYKENKLVNVFEMYWSLNVFD